MKKKRIVWALLTAVLLSGTTTFVLGGATAFAGESDQVYLDIDTAHAYENMETSYSQGYIPKVENGTVHIVVPFLSSGPLKNGCLSVELDMEENAPFVYANYRKEVQGSEFRFGEMTDPVYAYVFFCDIALEKDRRNGKYPVTVRAVGYSESGWRAELSSWIFITVTDGTDAPNPGQTEPPEPGTEKPPGQTEPGTQNPPSQTEPAKPGTQNPPSQTEPGTENPPDQTEPSTVIPDRPGDNTDPSGSDNGNGNENAGQNGETDPGKPGTENPPGQTESSGPGAEEPPIVIPDDPGENADLSGPDDGNGGENAGQNGETNPVEPGTEEPQTEEAETEELPLDDLGSAGGYSGGGYAGGGYSGGEAERIHRQPKFLLISNSLDDAALMAGQEYEFATVFQNMTGNEPVYNMKVTLSAESESIDFGCSSFYFDKVRTQETVSLPTFLSLKPNAQDGKAAVTFHFDYENDQGTAYTAEEIIELDVCQPSQVVLEGFRLAPQVYSTDTVESGFAVHNAGKAAVYNVKVDFAGQGLFAIGSVFVGNLEAGASYEGELRIYVGDKSMESLGDAGASKEGKHADNADELYGQTAGTLTLTYEDAYGEVYTQTQEYATEILEPQVVKLSVENPTEQTNQWQTVILVLIGILFVLTVAFMSWRLRRSKNAVADLLAAQRERNG